MEPAELIVSSVCFVCTVFQNTSGREIRKLLGFNAKSAFQVKPGQLVWAENVAVCVFVYECVHVHV